MYKAVPKTAAVRGYGLLCLKDLFLTLLAMNPTLMFTNNSLTRALTNAAMKFEELRANILQNMDIWSVKTAERLQAIMAHCRRLQNNAVRLRQATRSLDHANTKEVTKPANMIQPCALQVMRKDEHLGEEAAILEHSDADLAPAADSADDITPEDSTSNRDPKSPTPVKMKVKKSPTPIKKKSSSVKGAASVMSPSGPQKMKRPAAATVGSEFPKILSTKAHNRTYLQAQEDKGSAKKHLINVHLGISSNHLEIVTLIKQTMEEVRGFDKATAVDLREKLLKPRSG